MHKDTILSYRSEINGPVQIIDNGREILLENRDTIVGSIVKENPNQLFGCFSLIGKIIDRIEPESIYMIGQGAGILTRKFENEGKKYLVAEIDPVMVQISRECFKLDHANIHQGDGFVHLEHIDRGEFECIVIDASIEGENTPYLSSDDTLDLIYEKIDNRGSVIINYMSTYDWESSSAKVLSDKIYEKFRNVQIFRENTPGEDGKCNYIIVTGKHGVYALAASFVRQEGWKSVRAVCL